jgi:hypothetical protein
LLSPDTAAWPSFPPAADRPLFRATEIQTPLFGVMMVLGQGEEKASVSATSVKILQTASEIVGGDEALAERLGIGLRALAMFMQNRRHLPDALLLQVVDVILDDRQSRLALPASVAAQGRRRPTA